MDMADNNQNCFYLFFAYFLLEKKNIIHLSILLKTNSLAPRNITHQKDQKSAEMFSNELIQY